MLVNRINSTICQQAKANKLSFAGRRKAESIKINGFVPHHPGRVEVNVDGTNILFPAKYTLKDLLKAIDRLKNTRLGMYG